MFCQHCGKDFKIDEAKLAKANQETDKAILLNPKIEKVYVCPRCNHIVKSHLNDADLKELSQASHAEIHRAKNKFSTGMVGLMIGFILACISFLFLSISFKAANGYELTFGVEFFVFVALIIIGSFLIIFGTIYVLIGVKRTKKYQNVLKEIQNDTFVQ